MIFQMTDMVRIFQGVCFGIEYYVFFQRLYQSYSIQKKTAAFAAAFLIYIFSFGVIGRLSYAAILGIHFLLACGTAAELAVQIKMQKKYAFFLSVTFVLCRGIWNEQLLITLFPGLAPLSEIGLRGIVAAVTLFLLYPLQRWVIRIEPERTVTWRELAVGLLPACTIFVTRIAIYHYGFFLEEVLTSQAAKTFAFLGVFLSVATLISLIASEVYFSYIYSRRELERAEQQLQMQYQMFAEQRKSDEKLKSIYHDMANHLQLLKGLSNLEMVQDYIGSIDREAEDILEEVDTGNPTLNLILRQKAQKCRENGLVLEAAVLFSQGTFLTQMEICTLFANCIDNAMESVLADGVEDKTIRVQGGVRGGCLVVCFENAYAHELRFAGDRLASSKSGEIHGYGLKNVRAIVEKHDGTIQIRHGEGRFVLTWMMPIYSSKTPS